MDDTFMPGGAAMRRLLNIEELLDGTTGIYKLHVKNLPRGSTESYLRRIFENYGPVLSVFLSYRNEREYAMISYEDYGTGCLAIKKLNGTPPLMLKVRFSHETQAMIDNFVEENKKEVKKKEENLKEVSDDHKSDSEEHDGLGNLNVTGHAQPPPMIGLPPNLLVPQRKCLAKYGDCENSGYKPGRYNLNVMSNELFDNVESVAMNLPWFACAGLMGRGLRQPYWLTQQIKENIKDPEPSLEVKTIGTKDGEWNPKSDKRKTLKCNEMKFCPMSCFPEDADHLKKCDLFNPSKVIGGEIIPANDYFYVKKLAENNRHGVHFVKEFDKVSVRLSKMIGEDTMTGSLSFGYKYDLPYMKDFCPDTPLGVRVAVLGSDGWERGYVAFKKNDVFKVALIDKGVVVDHNISRFMSHNYECWPHSAVQIRFKNNDDIECLVGKEVEVENIRKDEKMIGDSVYGRVEIIPWLPMFEDFIIPAAILPTKSEVAISSFQTPKSLYVRSTDEKNVLAFLRLTHDIFAYSLEAPPLNRKPFFNEIICCKSSEDGYFYRAQVFQKRNDKFLVSFIDFGSIEVVSIYDMKALPHSFKTVPAFAVKIGLKGLSGSMFTPDAVNVLNIQIVQNSKFSLSYDNDLGDATLYSLAQEDMSLNKYIEQAQDYYDFQSHFELFSFENLKFEKWQIGQKLKLFGMLNDEMSFFAVDSESATFKSVFEMTSKMNEYCENYKGSVYLPRDLEICLAKYEEPLTGVSNWYRAVLIRSFPLTSNAEVTLIDYGNGGRVPFAYLRPMAPQFMNFPCPLKECKLYGISDDLDDEVKKEINSELSENSFEGVLMEEVGDVNFIFVPAINKILSKFNLPVITPPNVYADIIGSLEG